MVTIGVVPLTIILAVLMIIPFVLITYFGHRLCNLAQELGFVTGQLEVAKKQLRSIQANSKK